jgi:hypothetical protein
METPLSFHYCNASGREAVYTLRNWREDGRYVIGWCEDLGKVCTFLKFRVISYLDGGAGQLADPHPTPPPPPAPKASPDARPQILFTGFPSVQRSDLERRADAAGCRVVKTVTLGLSLICGGPNAGPAKMSMARGQGVLTLRQDEFLRMCETGEVPDPDEDWMA